MRTIFISANDTGSGKTYVTAALAAHLLCRGQRVQMVKVVETGVTAATPAAQTDAGFVKAFAAHHASAQTNALHAVTLQHFSKPIAPVDAAEHDGAALCFDALAAALHALPQNADWRLVEGAGGLAVPLEAVRAEKSEAAKSVPEHAAEDAVDATSARNRHAAHPHAAQLTAQHRTPRDWADFALAIHAEATLLVVADRLGAINQARLLAAYATARSLPLPGLWLNETQAGTSHEVRSSNARALGSNTAAVPLWAVHNHGELWPHNTNAPWLS